jgi:hypothetical protein
MSGEMPAHIAPVVCLKQAKNNKAIKSQYTIFFTAP